MDGAVSTGTETTGPATFAEAFAGEASSASTPPETSAPAASASAATTEPPAANATSEAVTTPGAGEPPKERWESILANARTKATEDWDKQYGWAKQVDQNDVREAVRIAQLAKRDPIAYVTEFIKDLQADPTYGAQLKSLAARALAQRTQAAPAQRDLSPIQVQLENGQTVGLYSADQIAALRDQWLAAVRQEMQPVTETVQTLRQREAALQQQAEVQQFTDATYTRLSELPGMDDPENRKRVGEYLAQVGGDTDDPKAITLAAFEGYLRHVQPRLMSGLSQKAGAKLLDDLKQKAAASTSVNPGSTAATAPRSYNSFKDVPPEMWR